MNASWNGQILVESEDTVVVEGNHYFPADSINAGFFEANDHRSYCPWKGAAHYYDIVVDGERNENAAWFYPEPKKAADNIKGRIAFWHGVEVKGRM